MRIGSAFNTCVGVSRDEHLNFRSATSALSLMYFVIDEVDPALAKWPLFLDVL